MDEQEYARRACYTKQRMGTEKSAKRRVARAVERGEFLRSYHCSYCGGWHLTSNKELED